MSGYFSVKGFEEFQHYKDRNPPWIKLYNRLLDDYEYARLPDASKSHLIAIWLLASRSNNRIPYDPDWIAKRINATDSVNLEVLVEAGFIVPEQPCSKMLASCKQDARPETEREGETEEERETDTTRASPAAAASAKYEFEGEVIRVDGDQFRRWREAFPNINLRGSLTTLDAYFAQPDQDSKNWFYRTPQILAKRDEEARLKFAAAPKAVGKRDWI